MIILQFFVGIPPRNLGHDGDAGAVNPRGLDEQPPLKAIHDGQNLEAWFTRGFYKHMLGKKALAEGLQWQRKSKNISIIIDI
jgi:hypothetical protein